MCTKKKGGGAEKFYTGKIPNCFFIARKRVKKCENIKTVTFQK